MFYRKKHHRKNKDKFQLAYSTLAGDRISFEKTFLLIICAGLKTCNIFCFENEARLEMFNLASKFFLAKKRLSKVSGNLKEL